MRISRIFILGLFLLLAGSVDSQDSSFEEYRITGPTQLETEHEYYSDVPYGEDVKNKLDLWVPQGKAAEGLVIFIHGGGFRGGDKSAAWKKPSKLGIGPAQIEQFLSVNLAFASINYRLLEKEGETEGVIKSLLDSKRALQFLRYHAAEFGFNGDRIALTGTSAGAGTSLWIGVNDDMGDPNSDDPVLRESTRVLAIGLRETQSTYDLLRWFDDVFPEELFPIEKVRGTALEQRMISFYGVENWEDLETDEIVEYRKRLDMLSMIDESDPPVYILNRQGFSPEKGKVVGNLLHSPYHAVALRVALTNAGLHHEVYIPAEGAKPGRPVGDFIIDQLRINE